MITLQGIKNKRLVRLWDLGVSEPPLVGEVHLGRHGTSVEPRKLRVHLQVDGLRGLDANDEFVSSNVFEDTLSDILELYANLDFGLVQRYILVSHAVRTQKRCHSLPLPALRMNGTPSHLGLLIQSVVAAKVGQTELGGTVLSWRYPG